jgi:GT2 family glycosyltransferase
MSNFIVDVIITSYEENIDKINRTIESCIHQSYRINKIWLVDDGSVNKPINKSYLSFSNDIELILLPINVGISAARNIALSKSTANFIVCMNVEIVLTIYWLENCIAALLNDDTVAAVYGKMIPYKQSLLSKWRVRFQEIKYDIPSGYAQFAVGHAVLFKKELLDKIGGYNEQLKLVHEDADICNRLKSLGFNIYYQSLATVISYQNDTLVYLAKKQMIRSTFGQFKNLTVLDFWKYSTKDLLNRIGRNIIKLRWYFLPIDIAIYCVGFWHFSKEKQRLFNIKI